MRPKTGICKTGIWTLAMLLPLSGLFAQPLSAEEEEPKKSVTIIKPQKRIPQIDAAAIDTERFELGVYTGSLSVEDFGTNLVTGLSFDYHITDDFLAHFGYATSDIDRANFEEVVGQDFLADSDREFSYTQLGIGYQIFYGRSFLGAKRKYNSHLYVTAGVENVEFAGEKETGFVIGTNYKVVATDWLTWNFSINNHVYERAFLTDKKVTNNLELSIGLNALF